CAFVFVAGPIVAVAAAGLQAEILRLAGEASVQRAAAVSLVLATMAAALSVALSWALASMRRTLETARGRRRRGLIEQAADNGATLVLVVPPIVIGAGWFILLRHTGAVFL